MVKHRAVIEDEQCWQTGIVSGDLVVEQLVAGNKAQLRVLYI